MLRAFEELPREAGELVGARRVSSRNFVSLNLAMFLLCGWVYPSNGNRTPYSCFTRLKSALPPPPPPEQPQAPSAGNAHYHQQPAAYGSGIFALSGGGNSDSDSGSDSDSDSSGGMSPPEAGAAEGAALLSSPSLSPGAGDDSGVGAGIGDGRSGSKGAEPELVNVTKLEARASTLWNVPNVLTMARVIAIPVRRRLGET